MRFSTILFYVWIVLNNFLIFFDSQSIEHARIITSLQRRWFSCLRILLQDLSYSFYYIKRLLLDLRWCVCVLQDVFVYFSGKIIVLLYIIYILIFLVVNSIEFFKNFFKLCTFFLLLIAFSWLTA